MTSPHRTEADLRYASLIARVLGEGERVRTRNADCLRTFGEKVVLTRTPLIVARRTAWRNALREWAWFMSGSNDVNDLHPAVRPWWMPWAGRDGRVAFNYSRQLRDAQGDDCSLDQVGFLLRGVREHPHSRRNVITTWNAAEMARPDCPITNCHSTVTQAFVANDNKLHLVTYQRSADVVCGLPHNWLQLWAFLMWLAHHSGRVVGTLTWLGGDVHVYQQHLDLARRLAQGGFAITEQPGLVYTPSSEDFRADDFALDGPYAPILNERAEMVV